MSEIQYLVTQAERLTRILSQMSRQEIDELRYSNTVLGNAYQYLWVMETNAAELRYEEHRRASNARRAAQRKAVQQ